MMSDINQTNHQMAGLIADLITHGKGLSDQHYPNRTKCVGIKILIQIKFPKNLIQSKIFVNRFLGSVSKYLDRFLKHPFFM